MCKTNVVSLPGFAIMVFMLDNTLHIILYNVKVDTNRAVLVFEDFVHRYAMCTCVPAANDE